MTSWTTPAGVTAAIEYDGSHRVTAFTQNGRRWTYSYNFSASSTGAGTTTVTDPDFRTKRITHAASPGPVTVAVDELSRTTSFSYDSYDRLTSVTRPDDNGQAYQAAEYLYDARGNLYQATLFPKASIGGTPKVTKAEYETPGCTTLRTCNKPIRFIDPRTNATDIAYDTNNGLPSSITYPANNDGKRPQTRNSYVSFGYWLKDSGGNVVQDNTMTMPRLSEVSICQTQSSCVNSADEVKTSYAYGYQDGTAGSNGLPLSETKQLGTGAILSQIATTYDSIGNAVLIDGPLAGAADTTRMIYDAGRQKIGEIAPLPSDGSGLAAAATRTSYNGDGQPLLVEQGSAPSQTDTGWSQFAADQRTASEYDGAGRLATVAIGGVGNTISVTQTNYDAYGRARCIAIRMNSGTFPSIANDGSLSGGGLNADACIPDLSGTSGADRILQNSYDPVGNLISVSKALGTPRQQIYAQYTYNVGNKRTSVIDANGNLATMDYDGFDRQIKWTFPSASTAGQVNPNDYEAYGYDATDNRTGMRKRDGREFSYAFDALNCIVNKVVPDACVAGYVCTPVPASATRDVFYRYDLRGLQTDARFDSLSGELSDPTGSLIAINSYDEYGVPAVTNRGRFQYTGQAWIPELSLFYYKARIYSPVVGRFLQTDPVGYTDQVNLYTYAADDPINSRDSNGLASCGTSLSKVQCAAATSAQVIALKQTRNTLAAVMALGQERMDIAAGKRESLSRGAQRTEATIRNEINEGRDVTSSDISTIQRHLSFTADVLTKNSYIYELGSGSAPIAASTWLGFSTIGLNPHFFNVGQKTQAFVLTHKPNHILGSNILPIPWPESYGPSSYGLWNAETFSNIIKSCQFWCGR